MRFLGCSCEVHPPARLNVRCQWTAASWPLPGPRGVLKKQPCHHSLQNLISHLNPIDQTVMGLATVLPKGDRGDVGRPGRQGITGPPVTIEEAMHQSSSLHLHVEFQGAQGPSGGPGAMGVKGETGLQGERGPRGPEGLQAWLSITSNHIFLIPRARREKGERMERPARTELLDFPDLLDHLALQGDMM